MVQNESERLAERTKATMKEQGMVEGNTDLPANIFQNRAERRVKLGLLVNKVVEEFKLNPNSDQIGEVVLEMSGVYEDPEAFKTWFLQDPKRRSQAEAMALERNVAKWIMKDAKVEDEAIEAVDLLSDATKGGDRGE
jgi:trigger factor